MCGIVSIILKDTKKVLDREGMQTFKELLYADALRGFDSTGIACIKASGEVVVHKEACTPGQFFAKFKQFFWEVQNQIVIGHNRAATKGQINAENAHPFKEKHISLVHNGTLRFHYHLKNVAVDSHAITHYLVENGPIKTLEKLDGAYALVWYNEDDQALCATRNNERPLFIIESDDFYFIASDEKLVEWICFRNRIKIKKTFSCIPGTLYTFKETKKKRFMYYQTKYKIYEAPKYIPPPQLDNVTQIRPYQLPDNEQKPSTDMRIGDVLEVLAYSFTAINYRGYALGSIKWEVDAIEFPDVICELYTDNKEDFSDQVINVTVDKLFYSQMAKSFVAICKNPEVPQQKKSDSTGLTTTSNGVLLTKEVIAKAEDALCSFCSAPFVVSETITLEPVEINGHIYKYKYHCPECADYFNERQLRIH